MIVKKDNAILFTGNSISFFVVAKKIEGKTFTRMIYRLNRKILALMHSSSAPWDDLIQMDTFY